MARRSARAWIVDDEKSSRMTTEAQETGRETGGVSAAVVDDDPRVAETVALHMRDLGCRTEVFTDATACRDAPLREPVDILITGESGTGKELVAAAARDCRPPRA